MHPLILASQSRYRRLLLERLHLSFRSLSPEVDESRRNGETPRTLAMRLAHDKAAKVAAGNADAVVIGSDQVATLGERILGKAGDHDAAREQLLACAGNAVQFLTAVCVLGGGEKLEHVDETIVQFRMLQVSEIDAYLRKDQPYDCAGSFKAEAYGITLFESITSTDPTALVGLPLIWLSAALRARGYPLP